MTRHADNQMGRWGAVSYTVGNIVGSGIFIVPSTIVQNTQSVGLALLVWVLSAAIAILGAFCYVELGTSIRRSGGDFAYLCHVRWNAIAFAFMACGCILTFPLTLAIQAETFAKYLLRGLHIDLTCHSPFLQLLALKCIGYGLCWLLLFLNFFSLRTAVSRFQMVCSLAKVLSIGLIIATGLYFLIFLGKTENLRDPFANSNFSAGPLLNAFFAGLFSYDGWDILNFGAEEVRSPGKSLAFAIPVGIISVALLYVTVNVAYFVFVTDCCTDSSTCSSAHFTPSSVVSPSTKFATRQPWPHANAISLLVRTFAEYSLGHFQWLVPFLVCIMLVGSLNSTLFVASRYMHAAARQGQLPAFLACTNQRHDSPRAALLCHLGLAIGFSFLGSVDQLISYVSFAIWAQRVFTICALLKIRLMSAPGPTGGLGTPSDAVVRTPLILPLVFLAISLCLVLVTLAQDYRTSAVGLAMLGTALGVFLTFLWQPALPRFRIYRKCAAAINDCLCRVAQLVFDGQVQLDYQEVCGNRGGGEEEEQGKG